MTNHSDKRRRGLTLLELVVVMAILVALAAVLIPTLPSLLGRANQASGVSNVVDLDKALQTYLGTNLHYPDRFDSLLDGGGTELSALLPTPDEGGAPVGGWVVAGSIDSGQLLRLQRAGITEVCDFDDENAKHATLYPYGANDKILPTPRPLEADGSVAVLAAKGGSYDGALPGVDLDEDHTYVVLGVGNPCTLCGPGGQVREAPMYLHHKAIKSPDEQYQRLCAIFDVGPTGTQGRGADANLVAVVGLKGPKLSSASEVLGSFTSEDTGPGSEYK